ncbi:MAG: hypothetical protein GY731_05825 [Gammaproteobacteria bacterium]|nr:hypothetical protein [Gammaproteobacteria bacterium]
MSNDAATGWLKEDKQKPGGGEDDGTGEPPPPTPDRVTATNWEMVIEHAATRLHLAGGNLRHADGVEAAWWFGLMSNGHGKRALRILVEAVK